MINLIILFRHPSVSLLLLLMLINGCSIKHQSFTSTQSWKPDYLNHLKMHQSQHLNIINLNIPPPPANNSQTTLMEIKTLLKLQANRTAQEEDSIQAALYNWQFKFGGRVISQLKDAGYPETALLIEKINPDIGQAIFKFKQKFDRIRPSFLNAKIRPSIPVPEHPAYPSGHATEAFTYALILGKLNPKDRETYLASAHDIAHLREIAGVHYPSDSAAGKILAEKIVEQLFESRKFRIQFEKSLAEHNPKRD